MADLQQKLASFPKAVRLDLSRARIEGDYGTPLPQEIESMRRYVDLEFVRVVLDASEAVDRETAVAIMEALGS